MAHEFTWGDPVRIRQKAPSSCRPGAFGDIVAIETVDTELRAARHKVPCGTRVFLVEFGDGITVEVPEAWVEPISN